MSPDLTLSSKLPQTGTTIFTTMSILAQEFGAINLGQGFPDFPMEEALIDRVNEAMRAGNNQYVHMNGLPLLRERLAEKYQNIYGSSIDPNTDITITPGGTYALYTAIATVVHPGDEVIVFEPAYDSYIPAITLNGGIPVTIPLQHPDYSIDWKLVKQRITPKTKLILLNSPHNPTGSVLRETDIRQLQELISNTDIMILSDEVYEHLIFDGMEHLSMLRYPDLMERSFVCFSFGKTYHCTGWKLGYCIAPNSLMKEFRKIHQFNAFTCNSPMQVALAQHLYASEDYLTLGGFVQQKRDLFLELMTQTPFQPIPSYGSYFQLYGYEGLSDENEMELAIRLVKEYGVATIPVAPFYQQPVDHKVLRFCFVKKDETLAAAAARLSKF